MPYRNMPFFLLTFTNCLILFVFKEKPTAEVSPKPYPKLSIGDELRLTCLVNKATVAITWKKNDDALIPRAQIYTEVDDKFSKLFIEEVVEGDSGEYSCVARNRPGIVARSTVKINVKGKTTLLFVKLKIIVIDLVLINTECCHCYDLMAMTSCC